MSLPIALPHGLSTSLGAPPFDELCHLIATSEVAVAGTTTVTQDELRTRFGLPGFDPATDVRSVRDAEDTLIAAATFNLREPYVASYTLGWVAPGHLGRGIGSAMLDWAERRAASAVNRAPEGARVAISATCNDRNERAKRLFAARGYAVSRYFLEMEIELDHAMKVAPHPEGITVRTLRPDESVDRVASTVAASFRDHFGFTESPPEVERARWNQFRTSEIWDDDLSWVAEDGDDMVGVCICLRTHGSRADAGYVATLGVVPSHRGRGLARFLLTTSFDAFARRGMTSVVLHVDADSLTGATRLYRGVGMHESQKEADFELELRPGTDLVVR